MLLSEKKDELLKSRIREITKLSTIPVIIKEILEVVNDEESSKRDLENVIERDMAISSRILGVANSPYYGFGVRVHDLTRAITILGYDMVKSLAVSMAIFANTKEDQDDTMKRLWTHSFKTAIAAGLLAEKTGLVKKDVAFLSGLLHDIGRAVFSQIFGAKCLALLGSSEDLLSKEKEAFGATHAEAGSWFAESLDLPAPFVKSILFHHSPEAVMSEPNDAKNLTCITYLADLIDSGIDDRFGCGGTQSPQHKRIMALISIDEAVIEEVTMLLVERHDDIDAFYT